MALFTTLLTAAEMLGRSRALAGHGHAEGCVQSFEEELNPPPVRNLMQDSVCSMKTDVDLPNDFPINNGTEERTSTAAMCCELCKERPDCIAWVWIKVATANQPMGACWMKAVVPQEVDCAVCVSGIVKKSAAARASNINLQKACQFLGGTDFKGGDVSPEKAPRLSTAKQCCDFCKLNPGCKTWTWTRDDRKCFLKLTVPQLTICSRCVSGIIESRVTNDEIKPLAEVLSAVAPSPTESNVTSASGNEKPPNSSTQIPLSTDFEVTDTVDQSPDSLRSILEELVGQLEG